MATSRPVGYTLDGSGPKEPGLEEPLLNPLDLASGGLAGLARMGGRALAKEVIPAYKAGLSALKPGFTGKARGIQEAIEAAPKAVAPGAMAGYALGAPVGAGLVNTGIEIHRQGDRWVKEQCAARAEFEKNKEERKFKANNPVESIKPELTPDEISDEIGTKLGVPSDYLKALTRKESGNNPDARAPTSSAEGLTQFTDGTWDRTLEDSGRRLGYRPEEGDVKPLRRDKRWSIAAGAELAKANAKTLQERLGRRPTQGEVYMAHFMGAKAAGQMLSARDRGDGQKPAAVLYPDAAESNYNVFYTKSGKPRSVDEVIALQTRDFSDQEF